MKRKLRKHQKIINCMYAQSEAVKEYFSYWKDHEIDDFVVLKDQISRNFNANLASNLHPESPFRGDNNFWREPMSLESIGKELGITAEAVRIIERKALDKLRKKLFNGNYKYKIYYKKDDLL